MTGGSIGLSGFASCRVSLAINNRHPVAGLGPATHVFSAMGIVDREDGDARDTPGQGAFLARSDRRLCRFRLAPGCAQILPALLVDLAHAELDLAAIVEAEDLDLDRIAHLDDVGHFADALLR
jgi:hypothetical protein